MPTTKKRVNVTMDERVFRAVCKLSRKRKVGVSRVSHDLIERALELEEDLHFSRIADERLQDDEPLVSHEDAWK